MSAAKRTVNRLESHTVSNEDLRLVALRRLDLLNDDADADLDFLVTCLTQRLGFPVGYVSLIDERFQWFKAIHGLEVSRAPREAAICDHTIRDDVPLVVGNTLQDPRFDTNPSVVGAPYLRAYAGTPIRTIDGYRIGTVCVADFQRSFGDCKIINAVNAFQRGEPFRGGKALSPGRQQPPDSGQETGTGRALNQFAPRQHEFIRLVIMRIIMMVSRVFLMAMVLLRCAFNISRFGQ